MENENGFASVVIHVPHASTVVPADVRKDFVLSDEELDLELLRITDWFTDELFNVEDDSIEIIQYPVSRLVADPERFPDDDDEPLSKIGLGAVYRKTSHLQPLRRKICTVDRAELLIRYYDPHHQRLLDAVDRGLVRGPVLIIDAHSYPLEPIPFEQDKTGERGRICLGTDAFHTPAWVVRRLREGFERRGYTVSIDTPFKGSIVPLPH